MAISFCLSIRSFVGSFVRLSLANKRVLMAAAAYHVGHGHLGRTSLCYVISILSGSKLSIIIDVEGGVSEAFVVSPIDNRILNLVDCGLAQRLYRRPI